jgi:hypothetical protein
MMVKMKFVREAASHQARQYENAAGARLWIPRSVCPRTMKFAPDANGVVVHEVEIEDWWLEKNPWPEARQKQLI